MQIYACSAATGAPNAAPVIACIHAILFRGMSYEVRTSIYIGYRGGRNGFAILDGIVALS